MEMKLVEKMGFLDEKEEEEDGGDGGVIVRRWSRWRGEWWRKWWWKKMEKMGCNGRPRSLGLLFYGLFVGLLAGKGRREEK